MYLNTCHHLFAKDCSIEGRTGGFAGTDFTNLKNRGSQFTDIKNLFCKITKNKKVRYSF